MATIIKASIFRRNIDNLLIRSSSLLALLILTSTAPATSDVQPRGNGRYLQPVTVQSLPAVGITTIDLTIPSQFQSSGAVTIMAGRTDSIKFEAELEVQADSRDDAQRQLESFAISHVKTNADLRITISLDPAIQSRIDFSRSRLNISIAVPEGKRILLNAPYLATEITGALGDVTITKTMAPVRVDGARGVVTATISNSRMTIEQILGGLNVTANNTRVRLTNISINKPNAVSNSIAKIVSEDGDVEINGYTGPIIATVTRGLLRARDVRLHGVTCKLENDGGEIDFSIDRMEPNVQLNVTNRYDDIKLDLPSDLDARLRLRTFGDSEFSINGIQHQISFAKPDRLEALCGEGSADIDIRALDGGTIQITGK